MSSLNSLVRCFFPGLGSLIVSTLGGGMLYDLDPVTGVGSKLRSVEGGFFPQGLGLIIPEPSRALLCLLGFCAATMRRRR
jgi:hypothetical protein